MKKQESQKIQRARKIFGRLLMSPPNSMDELQQAILPISVDDGQKLILEIIKQELLTQRQSEVISLLGNEFGLEKKPELLMEIIEDKAARPESRQLALIILSAGGVDSVAAGLGPFDPELMESLAITAGRQLLGPVLENHEIAREVVTVLLQTPEDDWFSLLERLNQLRVDLMVPAWLAYAYILQDKKLHLVHEFVIDEISRETAATDVDMWEEIISYNMGEATWKIVQETVMRTRTLRLNSRKTKPDAAPKGSNKATAWISQCDGVGAYIILICAQLDNGTVNAYNVCLRTTGELRDGFVLAGREPIEFENMRNILQQEIGYEFVRFPLEQAWQLVAESRLSCHNDTDKGMDDNYRAADCMQWAAAMTIEAEGKFPDILRDPLNTDDAFDPDVMAEVLKHPDFAEWFLNEGDMAELDVCVVPPADADENWIYGEAEKINTPQMREKLGSMFKHMAQYYHWRQDDITASQCRAVVEILNESPEVSFPAIIHYLMHSVETLHANQAMENENDVMFFGDNANRQMLRRECFPRLAHPKGKHMALLDITEITLISLDVEIAKLAADKQPRNDRLAHIAFAMAKGVVDLVLENRELDKFEKEDPARFRRMTNAMCKQSGWTTEEAVAMWYVLLPHILTFIGDVCFECPVFCLARPGGKMDDWFNLPSHPAFSE